MSFPFGHTAFLFLKSTTNSSCDVKRFGLNEKNFNAELGLCVVLHTHTRRLDYHPHVHIVIPGGGIHKARNEWRKIKGKYLFNGRALAKVFRGEFLQQLKEAGITVPITPKRKNETSTLTLAENQR